MDFLWKLPLALIVCILGYSDASPRIKYMMNSCKTRTPIYVNTSLVLEVTREFAEDRADVGFSHCSVDVVTDAPQMLFVHFEAIDISHEAKTPDRLHIYDYNDSGQKVRVTPPNGIYGVYEPPYYTSNTAGTPVKDYKSSASKLTLDYFGKPTVMYQGIRVLLTVYKAPKRHQGCDPKLMTCALEGICIHPVLRCDGLDNCGSNDNSDEHNCRGMAEATTDLLESYSVVHAVVAAIVSCAVFLIIVSIVVCWVKKHNRKIGYKPKTVVRWTSNGGVRAHTAGELARLYAPPSYESVVHVDEDDLGPPPDYSLVAACGVSLVSEDGATDNARNAKTDLKPSYSSVEVAILHECPRNHPTHLPTHEDEAEDAGIPGEQSREDSDTSGDAGSRETCEVTSDYVSRDSVPFADTVESQTGCEKVLNGNTLKSSLEAKTV